MPQLLSLCSHGSPNCWLLLVVLGLSNSVCVRVCVCVGGMGIAITEAPTP